MTTIFTELNNEKVIATFDKIYNSLEFIDGKHHMNQWSFDDSFSNMPDEHKEIILLGASMLRSSGYSIVSDEIIQTSRIGTFMAYELHTALCTEPHRNVKHKFSLHTDNEADCGFNVHTIIFYLENTFRDGNLCMWNEDSDGRSRPHIYNTHINRNITPNKIKIAMMDGDTLHSVNPLDGVGRRAAIVLQFQAA